VSGVRTRALAAAGTVAAAVVGGLGTDPESAWYRSLAKPPWQPPPLAFPLVWTPLYVLIGYGTGQMLESEPDPAQRRRLASLVAADLIANAGWCWLFFKGRSPAAGLAGIIALDALNIELLRQAARRDAKAATALAPYVAWGLFATALNADIWRRNR
jgi:translocator protein